MDFITITIEFLKPYKIKEELEKENEKLMNIIKNHLIEKRSQD